MKYLVTFLFIVGVSTVAIAQSHEIAAPSLVSHRQVLNALLSQSAQHTPSAMKTTSAIKERVIGESTYDSTTFVDSFSLKYSSDRGSVYDFNTLIYPYNYTYANSPMFDLKGTFTKPQVLADTLRHWTPDPDTLGIFGIYEKTYSVYDLHNNLTNYYDLFSDTADQDMSYVNTFNSSNNISTGTWFNYFVGGTADSSDKQLFAYNAYGKLTEDSTYQYSSGTGWKLVSKSIYTYDVYNNPTRIDCYVDYGTGMVEQLQYASTFDAANRLSTVITSYYDGDSLVPYVKDTFGYTISFTGGITYHNTWKEFEYDGINGVWVGVSYMDKHVNAGGLPDSVYINAWDVVASAWTPQTLDVLTYDIYSNPVTLTDYEYTGTAYDSVATTTTYYYYETYLLGDTTGDTSTAVANVLGGRDIKAYPNPAATVLTISQPGVQGSNQITLINMAGQLVCRMTSGSPLVQIPVSNFPSGVYVLEVSDANGRLLHRQRVVKE